MAILFTNPVDDGIVVMGMSCVGKTAFARQILSHRYLCFDALFPWHIIETFGLSISEAMRYVSESCTAPFVLDGWHLADPKGMFLPLHASIYLIYAPYDQIVDQYRVHVFDRSDYRPMFHKWYYAVDYSKLPTRFFLNVGDFVETSPQDFKDFLERNRQIANPSGTLGTVPFSYF